MLILIRVPLVPLFVPVRAVMTLLLLVALRTVMSTRMFAPFARRVTTVTTTTTISGQLRRKWCKGDDNEDERNNQFHNSNRLTYPVAAVSKSFVL